MSDFKLIKRQEILQTRQLYISQSPTLNGNYSVCVSDLIQIDQMSIIIESSRNITNVSAIYPKVLLQMATSVRVYRNYSNKRLP